MYRKYKNRADAGRALARELREYAGRPDVTVLALPRGGVPVAYEVARALGAPLDVFTVRKLGVPGQEELAFGAVAPGGVRVLNADVVREVGLTERDVETVVGRELRELERREGLYRGNRQPPGVRGRTVLLVDDGLATGATMRAAVEALRRTGPKEVVAAAPVASRRTCDAFAEELGVRCVCAFSPRPFGGVGRWYEDFSQTTDEEVRGLLEKAAPSGGGRAT